MFLYGRYGVVIQWQNIRLLTGQREFDSLQPYQQVLEIVILGIYKYIEYTIFKE